VRRPRATVRPIRPDGSKPRRRPPAAAAVRAALFLSLAVAAGCGKSEQRESAEPTTAAADTGTRYVTSAPRRAPPVVRPSFIAAEHAAPRPSEGLAPDASCVTPECHAAFGTADRVHGPIAAGDCFSCHGEDAGGHVYPLRREGDRTCTFCHQTGQMREHRHAALDNPGCMGCHDPHTGGKFLLVADSVEEVCLTCHVLDEGKHAHGPYAAGECAACHLPHESDHPGLLRGGSGADHCFTCHAETRHALVNAPYVHAPAANDCTTCHSPHASDQPNHLRQAIGSLCLDCHTGLEQAIEGATTAHAAIFTADSCANCHDAHAAGRPRLLRDRQTTLCLSCHNQPVVANDGRRIPDMTASVVNRRFLHGPVESGDCSACHNVHGSSHDRLLRQNFPTSFYARFDLQNYALCFSCHPQDLVLSERTTSLTDFRDGDRNLHYLHVHRDEKGRTCKTCHAIHGSDLPRHVATDVPFESSDWLMPIGFERFEDGGKCAPGCHVAMTYRRGEPATPPPDDPQKPGGQP